MDNYTEGYPRFGQDENDLTALLLDGSSTELLTVYDIFLTGAVSLVAGTLAVAGLLTF